ncbi:hypothetical protein ACH5RR_003365 [Cinchona calisaya]|uniref:Reverse transcriptase Ty1/copia-type domain-containing protein n=1 Tax=Cinchona calisaya TaxID=153742 RepID=A0ABD3AV79_9GENT
MHIFPRRKEKGIVLLDDEQNEEQISATPSSPPPSTNSNSNFPTSIPKKMRSLTNARCNFCALEPENFEEANVEKDWREAMEDEIHVIEKNKTWKLVNKPQNKEIIRVKLIYKVKLNQMAQFRRRKQD